MQEADAERRLQQLRGIPIDQAPAPVAKEESRERSRHDGAGRERKRRRIAGENDTDRDIRFAQEDNALVPKPEMQMKSKKSNDAPITDTSGHINLFPEERAASKPSKNVAAEAEKAKKKKEFEDQFTMRFSNAAGFKQAIGEKPWYQSIGDAHSAEVEKPTKDVWGNEDPRRRERQSMRIAADDPLAAIKKGVAGVRQVEKEKVKWREEKKREIMELEEAARRQERRDRKRRRRGEEDELEGFKLDSSKGDAESVQHRRSSGEHRAHHSHRRRSRSGERSRHRSHRHRESLGEKERPGWEVGAGGRYSNQFAQA